MVEHKWEHLCVVEFLANEGLLLVLTHNSQGFIASVVADLNWNLLRAEYQDVSAHPGQIIKFNGYN